VAPVAEVDRKSLAWAVDHFESAKKPFTGVAIDRYPDGKLKQRWPMVDGKWHGLVEEWDASGQQRVATNFDHGQRNGENTYWNPDGTVQKKQLFDHDQLLKEEKPPHP
jgi:antitoxin component YwqK of YwqJK toxin-antitoxin module